ncbi:MAG: CDP-alcohol phosphatidyltransferase family protein [Thermodesulfobacteriota bacterium]
MRLTANQVTLLRLMLIPIPCALLLGGPTHKSVALGFFVLVGLTDYLDGYLARRQGPTTLGSLMDPLADKIFVAAMFVPLAHQGIVPLWMVWLVFVREYAVTELRTVYGSQKASFRTSELAKYKTTIQMIGGCVIILNHIFGSSPWVLLPLGLLFLFACVLAWHVMTTSGGVGLRTATFMVLVLWALVMRWALPHHEANWAIMALITSVTVLSGLHYARQTWKSLGRELFAGIDRAQLASFVGTALVFPSVFLAAVNLPQVSIWLVLSVLALEMLTGGLNNLLVASEKPFTHSPPWRVRMFLINAAGLAGLLGATLGDGQDESLIVDAAFSVALLVSLAGCIRTFYIHRRALMAASAKTV